MEQILSNQYQILKELGRGGMGEVLLVKDLHLNRLAAAKRIQIKACDAIEGDSGRLESIIGEMELLRELDHPALPAVYDFFREEDWFYLVMEYVEGITLQQYLQRHGTVPVETAIQWSVELTQVLGYLHRRSPSIIYRDLKTGNIMIKPGGHLMLIDLGGCLKDSYGSKKEKGSLGTPGYSAPEQWKQKLQPGCDIYSLGAVLHEMLTGIQPMTMPGMRRPVREYNRSLPKELERIILKCTMEDVKERYYSMEQVKEALTACVFKGKWRRRGWFLGNICSLCFWFLTAGALIMPFVYGVPEDQLPFPYLYRPMVFLAAAFLFQNVFFRRNKNGIRRIEKSIQVTEKKFVGL